VVYSGITGFGGSVVVATWIVIQTDGPYSPANQAQESIIYSTCSYAVAAYFLTHLEGVWTIAKWSFLGLGVPLICIGSGLYYLKGPAAFATFSYGKAQRNLLIFITKTWDELLFYEAQVTERLPLYIQHKWSSYQQRHPDRAKLPLYQYKPLDAGEIRLLVLKRQPFYPSVVKAEIIHRPISPAPEYEAVSYRWGALEFTEEVIVDGCRFSVTKSAFDLLLARRSVWKDRTIWIDQICINQGDAQEKSEQVQLMRDIYYRAARVVSYLGGNWRYRLAGPLIYELVSVSRLLTCIFASRS